MTRNPHDPTEPDRRAAARRSGGRRLADLVRRGVLRRCCSLVNVVDGRAAQGETLDYSQFKSLLAQGRVVEVALSDRHDSRASIRTPDKALDAVHTRSASRIRSSSSSSRRRRSSSRGEPQNRWLAELLGWVFPILLIVALWTFFFRRMGGAEGGIMSFAPQPREDLRRRRREGELRGRRGRGRSRATSCARSSSS